MPLPTTRTEFKDYCLRNLGAPVIEINVDDDQVEDRVDEALTYFWDYHFDGSHKTFLKHVITDDDKTNGYIPVSANVIGVVNLFDLGDALSTNNLFNIRYQIALNDLYDLSRYDLVPYYMNFQNIRFIEEILVGKQMLRFNRHMNRLYIDHSWDRTPTGTYLIAEVYERMDPDTYSDVWADRWLLEYCTQLIKRQWGRNLTKFTGMQLPGGVQFNGDKLHDDAEAKIKEMQDEMIEKYSMPASDMIG